MPRITALPLMTLLLEMRAAGHSSVSDMADISAFPTCRVCLGQECEKGMVFTTIYTSAIQFI